MGFIFLLLFYSQGWGWWSQPWLRFEIFWGALQNTGGWIPPPEIVIQLAWGAAGLELEEAKLLRSSNFVFWTVSLVSALHSLIQWCTYVLCNHLTSNLMGLVEVLPRLFCLSVCPFICPTLPSFLLFIFSSPLKCLVASFRDLYFPW